MGGRQIRPATVWKTKSAELQQAIMPNRTMDMPPWMDVLYKCPPSETLVRTVPPRHRAPSKKATKPRHIYRPQPITFPEDKLRQIFFKDHPWELARPRVLVETDGKDYQHVDWSKGLRQPGLPLTGECVVQRQLWRMQNEGMDRQTAYDITRREFYRLRQEEEIEKRIAKEEARYVGAYFGKSRIDVGLMLEDHEFENWKVWAGKEAEKRELMKVGTAGGLGGEEGDEVLPAEEPEVAVPGA